MRCRRKCGSGWCQGDLRRLLRVRLQPRLLDLVQGLQAAQVAAELRRRPRLVEFHHPPQHPDLSQPRLLLRAQPQWFVRQRDGYGSEPWLVLVWGARLQAC